MKIIELRATNIKRLKAVEITPDGTMQVIGGRNAQGKSSVLDAIWLALGGGKASKETPLPIRDGEAKASVRLDLGDLIVTRSWTPKGTTLKVENGDGAQYSSPQAMLDGLVGQLSFDPLAFTRLSAREQREALLKLVDLGGADLDAMDTERAALYEQRTEIGRRGKALGDVPEIDEDLPKVEQSASKIIAKIRAAEEHNRAISQGYEALAETRSRITTQNRVIESLEDQLKEARRNLAELEKTEIAAQRRISELLPSVDVTPLEADLATVEDTNARIRANNAAKDKLRAKNELRESYESLTVTIDKLDQAKADALAAASFPVEGLGFDESGVTYQGVPLSQASSAEQIRVSLAMGMALNPKLRVLMIKDGSLLDADSMSAIREQVAERDYQLLVERVGNADEGAVIIEDGAVAS